MAREDRPKGTEDRSLGQAGLQSKDHEESRRGSEMWVGRQEAQGEVRGGPGCTQLEAEATKCSVWRAVAE